MSGRTLVSLKKSERERERERKRGTEHVAKDNRSSHTTNFFMFIEFFFKTFLYDLFLD